MTVLGNVSHFTVQFFPREQLQYAVGFSSEAPNNEFNFAASCSCVYSVFYQ